MRRSKGTGPLPPDLSNFMQIWLNHKRTWFEMCILGGCLRLSAAPFQQGLWIGSWLSALIQRRQSLFYLAGEGFQLQCSQLLIFDLPNKGDEVKYELDVDAINFMQDKYDIIKGSAPKIEEILNRIKVNRHANEDFLRSWLMIAVSTFLCPPTILGISPRCYPSLVDLSWVKKLNWCQFVVDQLKVAAKKLNKNNSVKGSILLLVVSLTPSNIFPLFLFYYVVQI